ncbi:MAG: hypothetical protein IJ503_02180 [Akkermansia sp.]|nr:hypothetical protein [Akkermansia sp.]
MKKITNYLTVSALMFCASIAQALEPSQHPSLCMPKPDNEVNRRMAAAENFPNTGWFDGKYWDIWGSSKPVPAEQPELIWYALCDTAPLGVEDKWLGRVTDWTTDAEGNVLIFFVDPVGNWNSGYYVVYRRNAQNMFEYVGRVFTGSHIGWWDMKGIELHVDGFSLTYLNNSDLPTVQHKFLYDKLEDFVIPRHDEQIATGPLNDNGQSIILCRAAGEPKRWLFRMQESMARPYSTKLLRQEDGSIHYLSEPVRMKGDNPPYCFRWLDANTFTSYAEDGSRYTWRLLPGYRIELTETGDSESLLREEREAARRGTYAIEFSVPNSKGQVIALHFPNSFENRYMFKLMQDGEDDGAYLLADDGSIYELPERVKLSCTKHLKQEQFEQLYYGKPERLHLYPLRFRWVNDTTFRTHSESGTVYTWEIGPDLKVKCTVE